MFYFEFNDTYAHMFHSLLSIQYSARKLLHDFEKAF